MASSEDRIVDEARNMLLGEKCETCNHATVIVYYHAKKVNKDLTHQWCRMRNGVQNSDSRCHDWNPKH